MGNYICLCNLQLVRGQQVCLAQYTQKDLSTKYPVIQRQSCPTHFYLLTGKKDIFQPTIGWRDKAESSQVYLQTPRTTAMSSAELL